MKVLLAEDDLLQRKLLSHLLTRAGHEVDTVTGGIEALERLAAGTIHLLLTDWDMPGMDGPTLCRQVRAAKLPDYIYILMLTGHTTETDLLAAFEAGADDYVRKPASEPELLARVKAGCRLLESERSLKAALEQVRELSITDSLTGIYNRRYLNEGLAREIDRTFRHRRSIAVIMADIDHFKCINDECGHLIGDEVLKCFADRLRLSTRSASDWIARYGGEEFVIVLPETSLDQATVVAEKIRAHCAATPMRLPNAIRSVTASFGVAAIGNHPDHPRIAERLLQMADQALYRSKRAGRNCVNFASD